MKVPLPKTVRVGPHTYTILRQRKAVLGNDIGKCHYDGLQICIRHGLPRSKAQEVLMHELLHACTYPTLAEGTALSDEQFVDGIAPTLLQVLRENPDLVAYLRS